MSWAGNPTANSQLAGWWYRVGATVIDGLIVGIVARIIGTAGTGVYYVILILGNLLYTALLLNHKGQTVGMMALGTRCVDQDTGGPIGTGRAFGRTALLIILQFTVVGWILDVLWPLWDARNQTLHDKAIRSLIVRTRANVGAPPYPTSVPGTNGGTSQPGGWGAGWQTAPGHQPPAPTTPAAGWQTTSPPPTGGGTEAWRSAPMAPPPPTEQSVPAAWYPDPAGTGQERWWDGKSWTDHLRSTS